MKAKTFLTLWRGVKSRRNAENVMRRVLAHAQKKRTAVSVN